MFELKPIHSDADYEQALQMFAALWGAKSGTSDGDQLDILATLIDAYENTHFPMDPPSAAATASFLAEEAANSGIDGNEPTYVFQIYKNRDDNFLFRVVSATGEVVLTSDTFGSQAEAVKAIESLKANLPGSETVDDAA